MHLRKLLLVVIALTIATFSVGLRGQGLIDGIKVTLPEAVTVGDKVLQPGEYEIRRPSSANRDILQIFNKDKMVYEGNVITVATGPDNKDPKETKVLLHHIGSAYYFDKIWMEDKNYGWEFPLPERVRALQRETAVNLPARYESLESTSVEQSTPAVHEGPGLAAQLDAVAELQDRDQQAALDAERASHEADEARERQARADRDRQDELDRQAQLDRNRVAALQPEPSPVIPSQSAAEPQSSIQSDTPEQLPETATNWLGFVLGGCLMLTLSLFLRPRTQE